ncbi:MAG: hypothetical protein HC865_20740 [Cyanobacteria bacterium RU_5_0]|nr:hypothetical protein [Cyanobacteria bacterium RU_5_0]
MPLLVIQGEEDAVVPPIVAIYIDRAGSDASAITWNFAKRHPKETP